MATVYSTIGSDESSLVASIGAVVNRPVKIDVVHHIGVEMIGPIAIGSDACDPCRTGIKASLLSHRTVVDYSIAYGTSYAIKINFWKVVVAIGPIVVRAVRFVMKDSMNHLIVLTDKQVVGKLG